MPWSHVVLQSQRRRDLATPEPGEPAASSDASSSGAAPSGDQKGSLSVFKFRDLRIFPDDQLPRWFDPDFSVVHVENDISKLPDDQVN
jgi:hypothetical protein